MCEIEVKAIFSSVYVIGSFSLNEGYLSSLVILDMKSDVVPQARPEWLWNVYQVDRLVSLSFKKNDAHLRYSYVKPLCFGSKSTFE